MINRRYVFGLTLVLGLLAAVAAVCPEVVDGRTSPKQPSPDRAAAAARAVLEAQQAAWNRGDVAGYMEGYAKEDSTTFISGDTLTRGWRPVLERYQARYDSREKMGTLAFTELEFKSLSDGWIVATGRWQLTLASGTPHGRFTLIVRRTAAGWRIVHDHTSSAP